MPRQAPDVSPPAWTPKARPVTTLDIRVVTPMFGGGYKAREVDTAAPVRAAAIRGHLRFWWRATAGAACSDPTELFEREENIWGSAQRDGQVSVCVRCQPGEVISYSALVGTPSPKSGPGLGYFLWPFQGQPGVPPASAYRGLRFKLDLSIPPEHLQEVSAAVRSWLAFGGVGARTRRGCGSLAASDDTWLAPNGNGIKEWLAELTPTAAARGTSIPRLAGVRVVLGQLVSDPTIAWRELAQFWARFRKGHVADYSPMHGSHWRDYDALAGMRPQDRSIKLCKPYLGLPINYQRFHNSPFYGTLKANGTGRMSSPVILKPLATAGDHFRPMIAVLCAQAPSSVQVNELELELSVETADRVLQELHVDDPLGAVVAAATRWHPNWDYVSTGGQG